MDLIKMQINRGRFGEFVTNLLESEYKRKKEETDKDEEWKLWVMYIHSYSDESFINWRNRVLKSSNSKQKNNRDDSLTDEGIKEIINDLFQE